MVLFKNLHLDLVSLHFANFEFATGIERKSDRRLKERRCTGQDRQRRSGCIWILGERTWGHNCNKRNTTLLQ